MKDSNRVILVASMLCVGASCYDGTDGDADALSARELEYNAPVLNGPVLQGPVLNGQVLQGIILNGPVLQGPVLQGPVLQGPVLQGPVLQGIKLNGPVLQGPVLQGIKLNGTLFSGKIVKNGAQIPVSGKDFIGSEWSLHVGTVIDGVDHYEDYVLRFNNIYQSAEQDDVYLYDIVHRPKNGGQWKSLCVDENNLPVPAVPLRNYWNLETGDRVDDDNVITFACKNAVLAKCTLWGYRPWASATRCKDWEKGKKCGPISLVDYHQACTRMARADYCGNGEPWTINGNAIDLWDHLSPQIESPTTDWFIEAEWTPDGAYCLNDIRMQSLKAEGHYPACFLDKKGKPKTIGDCGSLKNHRALITSTFNKDESDDDDDDDDDDDCGKGHGKGYHDHDD
ncbi:ADYC domain-containing protein [Nannocystis sp. RBIL2]|uniref:ADYC domain-containing protein n=1 Tax=Nannocystis sp. RBIL2 TaxID=2996788 RepID=UPI00227005BA|nr:ADYC domain-containing protein [Nannocystis sp. RBIL2]MCY1070861.1 ADYC domain-containing protein [Nannocystis sp. RBIL2]